VTSTVGANLLETIVAATRRTVDIRSAARPMDVLEGELVRSPDGAAFEQALRTSPTPRVIAECKRRSPSRGILRRDYDPAAHARSYEAAGAAAISVLTEPTFFDGSPDDLAAVRQAVKVPILRKDFILSTYQLLEAAVIGADAVLLIVGALEQRLLQGLIIDALDLGLAALVEVHALDEIDRAVDAGARIIGVNSRDLKTLRVDPSVLELAASHIPRGVAAVAESGIRSHEDLDQLAPLGYHAFLVGERLITQPDPGAALRQLRGGDSK
jgi:indole-3-glycerol phosphate synthase